MWNGQVKVITGLRRCGKSYLLKTIFANYLREERGVKTTDILILNLDEPAFARYCNPIELSNYVKHWAASAVGARLRSICIRLAGQCKARVRAEAILADWRFISQDYRAE